MSTWITGILSTIALSAGISYVVGKFLPDFLTKKIHALFAAAKVSPWWHDAAHPKRAAWLLSTAQLLEEEIPEPGTGEAMYQALGAKIAGLTPLLINSGPKWAKALEKAGDAIDLKLDQEIKYLATK